MLPYLIFGTNMSYYCRTFTCSQITATEYAWTIVLDDIESWELEEFLEDILNTEFNLVRDSDNDGSDLSLVSVCPCILYFFQMIINIHYVVIYPVHIVLEGI